MAETDNIELRSERVRYIIGRVPPLLVRTGISLTVALFVLLAAAAYLIPYSENVTVEVQVVEEADRLKVAALIPFRYRNEVKAGNEVQVEMEGYPHGRYGYLAAHVIAVSTGIITLQGENYFRADICTSANLPYPLQSNMKGAGEVLLSCKSLFDRVIAR